MTKENTTLALVVGLILAMFLMVGQSYVLKDNGDSDETISVSGMSEITVAPDVAYAYISISTENDDAKLAQSENTLISEKVISALVAQGISKDNVETLNFKVRENYYSNFDNLKEDVPKFEAYHELKVKVYELDKLGALINVAMENGANGVSNVEYSLSDDLEKSVRAQALEKAILEGSQKASSMAKTLGVMVGEVKSVSENNFYFTPYNYNLNVKAESYDVGAASSNYLSAKDVKVSSSVGLVYEIQ